MSDRKPPVLSIRHACFTALALIVAATPVAKAQSPQDFAAQATVSVPAGTPIARVALPAATFAVQTTRAPEQGFVTVHGGGFVASGAPGPDRLPVPYLPEGLSLLRDEGAGEVQTGLRVDDGVALEIGDPVFFRHAKAGELAEHFNEYLLVRGEHVVERVHTYRGDGQVFA